MALVLDDVLITSNPATGAEVGRVRRTPVEQVAGIVGRAREAQRVWAARPWSERRAFLLQWKRILARDVEDWVRVVRDEVGKPRAEALAGEVVTTLDSLRWTIRRAGRALRDEKIGPGWQRWLLMRGVRLRWRPLGVIGMIGTWNYPLSLNAPAIAQALAAGNAVVWKPSELAVMTGQQIQRSLEEAGLPEGLVAAVYGGPEVGQALVEADLDKAMFTGGIESGRRVLAALGARGVPALAELSGFDPAIVLKDGAARVRFGALTWGAFIGCGQTCIAVKRVYVVGDAAPWAEALGESARSLKVGDPARPETDVGPMITAAARDRLHTMIQAAVRAGARVLAGGTSLGGPGSFYAPTVLLADGPEPEAALAGAFGPVVVVRGVPDQDAAIAAANASPYALAASVWGRNRRKARAVADQLQAGMVAINDAVTPAGLAAAPFGGCKASGYGRTHGVIGLQFAQPVVLAERRPGGYRPQLFPYAKFARAESFLGLYRRLFHPPA